MTILISDSYVEQNKSLHDAGHFGVSGYKWASTVGWIIHHHQIHDVLDYGAGQQTLKNALKDRFDIRIKCYDPAIPELATQPSLAELLTCTDVLEHIEPENIDSVLNHICSIASRYAFLVIPTGPAAKTLPDGRNAHLIQKPVSWWLPKLLKYFDLISLNNATGDIVFFGSKKSQAACEVDAHLLQLVSEYGDHRLMSITFDGMFWNLALKEKRLSKRIVPRVLSLLMLGAKVGVTKRLRHPQMPPRLTITRY
jgi:hypothetical protein